MMRSPLQVAMTVLGSALAAYVFLTSPISQSVDNWKFWLGVIVILDLTILTVYRCAALEGRQIYGLLTAALFGLWLLYWWQLLVTAFDVPRVLLPAPAAIMASFVEQWNLLWGDFVQTVVKSVFTGWIMGCALGFGVAVAISRYLGSSQCAKLPNSVVLSSAMCASSTTRPISSPRARARATNAAMLRVSSSLSAS